MRILVFSDTHRNIDNCLKLCNNLLGVDLIIHLGDMKADADEIERKTGIKVETILGNNEFILGKTEKVLEFDGIKIFITHGHKYGVKTDKTRIAEKVKATGAYIGLFGHTHIPFDDTVDGIRLLNPGSAGYALHPSYGIIEIENGKLSACVISF